MGIADEPAQMTTTELRELKAAVALPLQTDGINVRDADGVLVCVCNDIFADKKYAALIVALVNSAEELLDKADMWDKHVKCLRSK